MKLVFKAKTSPKAIGRLKKKVRIRRKLSGTPERPRLCVYKSGKHIYATLVDDNSGNTIMSFSSLKVDAKKPGIEMAKLVGAELAKLAISKNIKDVVFDRNGFIYHGRIQAVADGARTAGLNF